MNNCKWGGCTCSMVAKVLMIIGGLNWGLVGVGMLMGSDWNVLGMILGSAPTVEAIVYILVGVSAVVELFGCMCKKCKVACSSCAPAQPEKMDQNM